MKVSVIVAVYNASEYLGKCIESLMGQSYRNIEILCVDDCSTDDSMAILNRYAEKDERINIYKTERNSGPAVARNIAIEHCKGDITAFVDSDDWLSADAIEKAVEVFSDNYDTYCVLFQCIKFFQDGRKERYYMDDFSVKSGKEAFIDSLTWKIHGIYVARTSLYKRFPYDTTCRTFSDDNTTRLHYYFSKEVKKCDGIYYYRYNPKSISNIKDTSRINHILANESMKKKLLELDVDDNIISMYEYQRWLILVDTYMFYYINRKDFDNEEKDYCLNEIKRIWKGMETHRIPLRHKLKLGYYPFRYSWNVFRMQEEAYFFLKRLFNKLFP